MKKRKEASNADFLVSMTTDFVKTHWRQAVAVLAAGVVFLLSALFLPQRALLLLCMILSALTTAGALLVIYVSKKRSVYFCMPTILVLWILSLFTIIFRALNYSFIDGSLLPFWKLPLALGGLVSAWITIRWIWKKAKMPIRILSFLLLFVVLTCIFSVFASHLNYTLDSEEPIRRVARIEEIDSSYSSGHAPTRYYFTLTVDGETVYLDVSWSDYMKYEVGEVYKFEQYNGAFDKPFYISSP